MPADVRVLARHLSLSLVVLSGLPSVAHAFCRTTTNAPPADHDPAKGCFTEGALLHWRNACTGYSVQRNGSRQIPFDVATRVIDASFATWMGATCSESRKLPGISLTNLGPVDCAEVRYNPGAANQNTITFRDGDWPYRGSGAALALTTLTFNKETGELFDADMEINTFGNVVTTSGDQAPDTYDLQSIITHEAGHFLGLAHTSDPDAKMFGGYRAPRVLAADDVSGLCSIYPDTSVRVVSPERPPTCTWCPPSVPGQTERVPAGACDPSPRRGLATACSEEPRRSAPPTARPGKRFEPRGSRQR